jgi:hypothetical protein
MLRFVSLARSDCSWNRRPANFNFDRRSASYKRWPRRCDGFRGRDAAMVSARLPLHWHANRRSNSTIAGRVASAAQRKRTQTDSAARAPQTVRSDSTNVVTPLVQDELQAWPAWCAMLICAARSCTDAVRVAIRPSTVHAELQTLCSNTHGPDSAALVKLARANQFEARRPSQRSALAHRNLACQCRRVCAHDNSARKETYADTPCWHGAKCGSSIRDSPSRQSDFRRSHVRHEVHQRVSA